jgi:hypothetical protein
MSNSHIIHFTKIDPLFHTSTLKWCLFLNLLIANGEIPSMFNSLLIYKNVMRKNQNNKPHIE